MDDFDASGITRGVGTVHMKEAQLQGITPYVLRLAAHYAALGIGRYTPKGYAAFDRIEVRQLAPWTPGPNNSITESMMVLIVEFYSGPERIRYVEMALSPCGFGGESILKEVK
jgi:hypothetical protein